MVNDLFLRKGFNKYHNCVEGMVVNFSKNVHFLRNIYSALKLPNIISMSLKCPRELVLLIGNSLVFVDRAVCWTNK